MTGKNSYKKGKIKKSEKGGSGIDYDLAKKINEVRNKLNDMVSKENISLSSAEVVELSQKLDELIAKYLKKI